MVGQEPWELRGASDARIRALELAGTLYMVAANAGTGSTASASFVDYPGPIDLIFTKRLAATSLIVTGSVGAYKTTAVGLVDWGLSISGTDYVIVGFFYNDLNAHRAAPITVPIAAGLAPGTYTARLRWRTGVADANANSDDKVYLSIAERTVG
jgi:hypothetical protein